MNFTNYRDEVIKFLKSEADECCDFLDLRSDKSKRVDRLKYYRKLEFLKDILKDSEMIDRVLKVEIVSSGVSKWILTIGGMSTNNINRSKMAIKLKHNQK